MDLKGQTEDRLEDHSVGRLEGRMRGQTEDHSEVLRAGLMEGHSEVLRVDRTEALREGRLEDHSVGPQGLLEVQGALNQFAQLAPVQVLLQVQVSQAVSKGADRLLIERGEDPQLELMVILFFVPMEEFLDHPLRSC